MSDPVRCNAESDAHPMLRALDFVRHEIGCGGSFRDCDPSRHVLAVWIGGNVRRIGEWHRAAFLKDFRTLERMIDHGGDIERRIKLIEHLLPVLDEPAKSIASRLRADSIPELATLSDLARCLVRREEFLSVGPSPINGECGPDALECLRAANNSVMIAARGFRADREGWEALHVCVERWRASAMLAGFGSDAEALKALSASLFRCRGVSRLLDSLHSARFAQSAAKPLMSQLMKIRDIRLAESDRVLTELRVEGMLLA